MDSPKPVPWFSCSAPFVKGLTNCSFESDVPGPSSSMVIVQTSFLKSEVRKI